MSRGSPGIVRGDSRELGFARQQKDPVNLNAQAN